MQDEKEQLLAELYRARLTILKTQVASLEQRLGDAETQLAVWRPADAVAAQSVWLIEYGYHASGRGFLCCKAAEAR